MADVACGVTKRVEFIEVGNYAGLLTDFATWGIFSFLSNSYIIFFVKL
jgi:hypothetical protein